MNLYLKKFFNDVSDPSWPTVDTYIDYYKLPLEIQKECELNHRVLDQIDRIENYEYFCGHNHVYQHQNLIFVPVLKCASSYYREHFGNQFNWQSTSLHSATSNSKLVGVLMEPTTRWLKGITEWLWTSNLTDAKFIENIVFSKTSPMIAPDAHTQSYHEMFGPWLSKIHWIPMDWVGKNQTKQQLLNFFQQHGCQTPLNFDHNLVHQSSSKKLELFEKVKSIHHTQLDTNNRYLVNWHKHLAKDLKFYHNLVRQFQFQ
jgi:hypothetical protein